MSLNFTNTHQNMWPMVVYFGAKETSQIRVYWMRYTFKEKINLWKVEKWKRHMIRYIKWFKMGNLCPENGEESKQSTWYPKTVLWDFEKIFTIQNKLNKIKEKNIKDRQIWIHKILYCILNSNFYSHYILYKYKQT